MPRQAQRHIEQVIAANLRRARLEKGYTHRELAALLGVDQMYISRWERKALRPDAKAVIPNLENFARLAEVLGRDISWFYIDSDPERKAA